MQPPYLWGVLAAVYVLARLGTWGYPFDSDQWIFYYVGANWFHGGSLYVTAWDHKPPTVFFFNGLLSVLIGSNIVLQRAVFTLLSLVDICLFYRLSRHIAPRLLRLDGGELGGSTTLFTPIAMVLYVFWRDLSQFASSGNNDENIGVILVLGMMLAFLSFRVRRRVWKLVVAGCCLAILFWLKGNFLLLGAPIVLLLVIYDRQRLHRLLGDVLIFLGPLVAISIAWIAYFQLRGTLRAFLIASFFFNSKYAQSAWGGDLSSTSVRAVSIGVLLLLLVPVAVLGWISLQDRRLQRANQSYWLILLSTVAALGLTLDVGSFYPYYFLIAMPAFVLVMAYGLLRLPTVLRPSLIKGGAAGMALCMAVSFAYSTKQLLDNFVGPVRADALEYQAIASYVDAHTAPSDAVFDYDYGATFYQLAHRRSGSRFVSASPLLLDYRDHYGFDLDAIFIRDMETSRAKYVIVPRSPHSIYYENGPVVAYLSSHYARVRGFPDYLVLLREP